MSGNPASYSRFCAYLEKVSGIVLTEEKKYLFESRIAPIMQREKIGDLNELIRRLESGANASLVDAVIQSMTINETYFFRDKAPFDLISDELLVKLEMKKPPGEPLRIWSAACSTGQEPYSLAMIVEERQALLRGRPVEIVATDLSEAVLSKARAGIYSTFEVERGLSPERLKRHFASVVQGWRIKEEVRRRVTFRSFNLLADYSSLGRFDLILCRNVLIYFNGAQKKSVLRRLGQQLRPTGLIMLGSCESILGIDSNLEPDGQLRGCYQVIPTQSAPAVREVGRSATEHLTAGVDRRRLS